MKELVDSVHQAVGEADAASKNKKIVDLNHSLSLLESKFAGLRAALSKELGAKAQTMTGHSESSKELMNKSSELVQRVIAQRKELSTLASDIAQIDSAVRAIRESLSVFEKDAKDLEGLVTDLHRHHEEMSLWNKDAKMAVTEISSKQRAGKISKSHMFLSIAIIAEVVAFVGFLYFKSNGSAAAHKAYGKFG